MRQTIQLWRAFLILALPLQISCTVNYRQIADEARSKSWSPSLISLSCADELKCPAHQGLLVGYKRTENQTEIVRCTATLYDSTHIISAGHCRDDSMSLYFLAVPKPGLKSHLIAVKYVGGEARSGDSDYASFELAEPISDRSFVHPVNNLPADFTEMVGFVVNKTEHEDHFTIDALECRHFASRLSERTIDLNPKMFYLPGCRSISTHAGAIIVQPDDYNSAYGVLSGGSKLSVSEVERKQRINSFGFADWTRISNVRCIHLPGWPVVESACQAKSK